MALSKSQTRRKRKIEKILINFNLKEKKKTISFLLQKSSIFAAMNQKTLFTLLLILSN